MKAGSPKVGVGLSATFKDAKIRVCVMAKQAIVVCETIVFKYYLPRGFSLEDEECVLMSEFSGGVISVLIGRSSKCLLVGD